AQLTHHTRLRFADQVPAYRDRAEYGLYDRYIRTQRPNHLSERTHLLVEHSGLSQRNRPPRLEVGHRPPDDHGRTKPVARRAVLRPERLRKGARPRLEFDEVPTEPSRSGNGNLRQLGRRPLLSIRMPPRAGGRPVGHTHRQRRFDSLTTGDHEPEFKLDFMADIATEAARLKAAANAKPLRLPINRRVDESHHATTSDGLSVWYTIQVSPHGRIQEAVFEREDRMPTDDECRAWLELLIGDGRAAESPSFPGSTTRRFEVFDHAS